MNRSVVRLATASVFAGLLAACGSTPMPATAPATAAPAGATSSAPAPRAATTAPSAAPVPQSAVATVTVPPHLDAKSAIATDRSVYFDFDDFSIRPEFTGLLERHGRYLAANAALAIRIEGHADERGSKEYNLALGQKRAEAVLRALRLYGVRDGQAEPVSWGEERPKASGHDEAAWAQNRRADLQYPSR